MNYLGNISLLDNHVHGFLCSRSTASSAILPCLDWAVEMSKGTIPVMSTFHSEIESAVIEILKKRGYVALANGRTDFAIIHIGSGNHDGKHPERFVEITQANHNKVLDAIQDCMRQAAAWWAHKQ